MSFSNLLAQDILDDLFGNATFSPPATLYVGLSSTTPGEDGTGVTEPLAADGYDRVATTASDWNAATLADPSLIDNLSVITFPTATNDWLSAANLTHFVIFDTTLGNSIEQMLMFGALTTAKPVLNGDTAEFAAGDLNITLD